MWNLKRNDTNEFIYKTEADSQTSRMSLWLLGEGWGEGTIREFGMDMYTQLYLKGITKKHLLISTWNSAQYYVAAWMGGEFGGRMDTCICMAESLRCSPETITTLFIGCQSVQFSSSVLFDSLQPHGLQHTRLPCPSPTPTLVHHIGDAIQPSHPLLSPSPPTFNLSQHWGLFQ